MQKFLIVLLAVCLVSVHAFVKRDAPAEGTENVFTTAGKNIQGLAKTVGDEITKAVDPEKIKSQFSSLIDQISDAIKKAQEEAPKA